MTDDERVLLYIAQWAMAELNRSVVPFTAGVAETFPLGGCGTQQKRAAQWMGLYRRQSSDLDKIRERLEAT